MAAPDPLLYTPEQAADLLGVKPSWLRRKAAARAVPCTFVGKHLRFSRTDLETIIADGAHPARWAPHH
jgi:excisionase family DNA binding protein